MRPEDDLEFARVLNGLAVVKTGAKVTKEALAIWWNSMQPWSIEEFRAAASHFVTAAQWMPNPYHFEQMRRAGEETAPEAWAIVLSGAPLDPGSRVWRAAQCVGGQQRVRHANTERDLPHIERRFLEAFRELADVEPVRELLPNIAKPAAHRVLRGPAAIANFLPQQVRQPAEQTPVAAPATEPATPRVHVSASVKVERLARSMPSLTDDELARIACVPVEYVRQVRASLESAA